MDFDVIVIGGGPIGCAVARDIAAAGCRVLVVEEHPRIGDPLRCSGLISSRTLQLSRVSTNVVLHKLTGARVHAPGGEVLELYGNRVYALAVDREAFDRDLAAQAAAAGAEIMCGMRAEDINLVPGGVQVKLRQRGTRGKIEKISSFLVIGADGYRSSVARKFGILPQGEKVPLYAAEVELPGSEGQIVDIFLGNQIAPGWFGWVIPTGRGTARVGIGADRCPYQYFQQLVINNPEVFQGMQIVRCTSGYVPVGFYDRTYGPHTMLVGDAAGHVKPISGGGLYLGLIAAEICAAVAVEALQEKDFSEKFLARYQERWEKAIGEEIYCGLKHRDVFLSLTDDDMDKIISFFNKPYWRKLILRYGDIDFHSALAVRLSRIPIWAKHFIDSSRNVISGLFM